MVTRLSPSHATTRERERCEREETRNGFRPAAASMAELDPSWEAVTAEDGRTYYWNVETNETSCASPSG